MNVSLSRLPSLLFNLWHVPNVRLPFFGHTEQDDQVSLQQTSTITFKPDPPVVLPKPAPPSPTVAAQVKTLNLQTQAAINQITSRARVLGHPELKSITKLLDNAQKQLTGLEKGADPETQAFILAQLKDVNQARQTYSAMDDTDTQQDKKRQDIKSSAARDAQSMKDSLDKTEKAFNDANDHWDQAS
ncbi:MAG: hypothetical protein ACYCW6_03175 [Candidatus Xenobia bacterium]